MPFDTAEDIENVVERGKKIIASSAFDQQIY